MDQHRKEQENITARRAVVLGLPYADTSQIEKEIYTVLNKDEVKSKKVVPIRATQHRIDFGITTSTSQKIPNELKARFQDHQLTFSIISDAGFDEYMKLYDPPRKIEYQDIAITAGGNEDALAQISATLLQVRADDMLAYLVQQAFRLKASDIHLETRTQGSRIRFRVHGVLHTVANLDNDKYRQLISALASSANISTSAEYDQTGHVNRDFKLATGEVVNVNLRVETVPAINGIDGVLRLFNFNESMMQLDKLGLDPWQKNVIDDIISHPSGLVLIVGPTGSGKTTTLYSLVNELNSDDRKIITLEDPVEYQIDGITQIPVVTREGESFADKFRAVLRLDPDVIMVGEIRDIDTAKTALQAALTGHLVLATYHASSAAGALTRMLDAIGENPLYASAIRLIQAQRLVRELDPKTKTSAQISPEVSAHIQQIIETMPPGVDKNALNANGLQQPGSSEENPFGYSGQLAIRELMLMTPELQKLLARPKHELTTDLIEETATSAGMLTMKQDGILKMLEGRTTFDEVTRVIG